MVRRNKRTNCGPRAQVHCQLVVVEVVKTGGRKKREPFCHQVRKFKDRIKRLEELLEVRVRDFNAEHKKSYETITKQESEISHLKKSLQLQEEKMQAAQLLSKQENEMIVTRYEALKKNLSDQNKEVFVFTATVAGPRTEEPHTESKVVQLQAQLLKKDAEIQELSKRTDTLTQIISNTSSLMSRRREEHLQSNKAWEAKYKALEDEKRALEDKSTKGLDEKCLPPEQQGQITEMKAQIEEMEADIKVLTSRKERMFQVLTTTRSQLESKDAELVQCDKAWEAKYKALQDKFEKDLAEQQQSWEFKVIKMTEEKREPECIIKDQARNGTFWEEKYNALEDLTRELAGTQQGLMTLQTQHLEQVTELEEHVQEKDAEIQLLSNDLAEKKQSWETKAKQFDQERERLEESSRNLESLQVELKEKVNQMEEQVHQRDTDILGLCEEKESLSQQLQQTKNMLNIVRADLLQSETKFIKITEEKKGLEESLVMKEKLMENDKKEWNDDKKELEDCCLNLNRKRKSFLFFKKKNPDNREEELQMIKSKMQRKELKKKEKAEKNGFVGWIHKNKSEADNKVVEEAAAGCSAQAGQQ
ncbi:paramyosin-like [Centropristis striata]|uniref:paramyosin-like n=1 Tax=Centropristis striata TaxID=184440 RepID=UPI0027E1CD2E|nr:paramyosin-like [Centropristis striata]